MRDQIKGSTIKLNDMLDLWIGRSRVVKLEPYTGPLAQYFPDGAQIATFDTGKSMTIDNRGFYPVV